MRTEENFLVGEHYSEKTGNKAQNFRNMLVILKDLKQFTHEHITQYKNTSKYSVEHDDDRHYAPLDNMIYTFTGIVRIIDNMNGIYESEDGQDLWSLDPEYFKIRLELLEP